MTERSPYETILLNAFHKPGVHSMTVAGAVSIIEAAVEGDVSSSGVSGALNRLRMKGVLTSKRNGRNLEYSLVANDTSIAGRLRSLANEVVLLGSLSTIPTSELLAEIARRTK